MNTITNISWDYVNDWIYAESTKLLKEIDYRGSFNVYGIPRGGMILSGFFNHYFPSSFINIQNPEDADIILDDIIDSGRTKDKYLRINPNAKFISLIDKLNNEEHAKMGWVSFPWESDKQSDYDDLIIRILQHKNDTVSDFTIKMIKDAIDCILEGDYDVSK